MGAPIRKAMKGVLEKTNSKFVPCQIDYRKDERYWVFASDNDVRVIYEVNFTSEEDQALARIFLLEMKDTRGVQNAPAIVYHDKQFPTEVTQKFPGAMQQRTSNGSISMQIGELALKKNFENTLSQIIGFKQYLHYHLHAIKI